jgi:hypothetical protein
MTPANVTEMCKHGHPWAPETTVFNARGFRRCWLCQRFDSAAYQDEKRGLERRTWQLFDELMTSQGGVCAACFEPGDPLEFEHDPVARHIRGLACRDCNVTLMVADRMFVDPLAGMASKADPVRFAQVFAYIANPPRKAAA